MREKGREDRQVGERAGRPVHVYLREEVQLGREGEMLANGQPP